MSDRDGEQGKERQLNEYAACFNLNSVNFETQYVAAGVDSVAHCHKCMCGKH